MKGLFEHEVDVRMNARLTPEKVQAMMDAKFPVYVAPFIHVGVCGYQEAKDITYVTAEALERMRSSFIGRPVVVGHDLNITPDNMEEKAKGFVVDCWTEDGDKYFVKFVVKDEKTNKKIREDGYNFVSCAYMITEKGEPEVHDGLTCDTVVLDGFYHHLAITNNPRYDDSQIWRQNENNDLKNIGISDIVKLNESKEKKMFGWKKHEVSIDEDVVYDTDLGRLNVADLVAKVNELAAENAQLKENAVEPVDEAVEEVVEEQPAEEVKEAEVVEETAEVVEENHETDNTLKEAVQEAAEQTAQTDVVKEAIPKENENNPHVARCTARGLRSK